MPERLVIIGGVAGGLTAAAWARRQSDALRITVIEKGEEISYSECGMPYAFSGQVRSLDALVRYRPQEFAAERDTEVVTGARAETISLSNQCVEVRSLHSNEARKHYYDYLIIATGARPVRPRIEGIDLEGVFTLRHMPEARALNNYLKSANPRRALIVGAGFLGLEMAEALSARGLAVTIVERSPRLLKGFEGRMRERLLSELHAHGIEVSFNQSLTAVEGRERVARAITDSGPIEADLIIIGVGIAPEVELARAAGIRIGATGAIAVSETQSTNVPNIYAAGDCCEALHLVSQKPAYVPLGTTANKQGRVAGINAAGGRAQFKGIVGTMAVKVFNLEAASTGLTLEAAQEAGFMPRRVEAEALSRAGYYPGAQRIDTELVYDERTGRLLGAQMLGGEGVAKRIDVVAAALYARMRVDDLLQLDLSYAPPFATVWDAIQYAARKAD